MEHLLLFEKTKYLFFQSWYDRKNGTRQRAHTASLCSNLARIILFAWNTIRSCFCRTKRLFLHSVHILTLLQEMNNAVFDSSYQGQCKFSYNSEQQDAWNNVQRELRTQWQHFYERNEKLDTRIATQTLFVLAHSMPCNAAQRLQFRFACVFLTSRSNCSSSEQCSFRYSSVSHFIFSKFGKWGVMKKSGMTHPHFQCARCSPIDRVLRLRRAAGLIWPVFSHPQLFKISRKARFFLRNLVNRTWTQWSHVMLQRE